MGYNYFMSIVTEFVMKGVGGKVSGGETMCGGIVHRV